MKAYLQKYYQVDSLDANPNNQLLIITVKNKPIYGIMSTYDQAIMGIDLLGRAREDLDKTTKLRKQDPFTGLF